MGKACRVKFATKTHTKRRGFCKKKINEDLMVVNTVNMDINSSVNIVNNDIVNIADTLTASERESY